MRYYNIFIITLIVVAGARAFHAAYLNRGKVILSKHKSLLGLAEFCFLALALVDIEAGFSFVLSAAPLFLGARLFSDYQLNLMRGLSFHYIPPVIADEAAAMHQRKYLAFTDALLRKVKPQTRLAIRSIILVAGFAASYYLYTKISPEPVTWFQFT